MAVIKAMDIGGTLYNIVTNALVEITLEAINWTKQDENKNIYFQAVTIANGTSKSVVSLQPTDDQILTFMSEGINFVKIDNDNGTFIAKVGGNKPTTDIKLQGIIYEVE